MFLNQLNDSAKENFLKVCVHAALANGVFAEEEKNMLFAYCREMNVEEVIPETPETFDELVSKINAEVSKEEKNIYVLEILALMNSDGSFDDKENDFMDKLTRGLGIDKEILVKFDDLLKKYIEISKELYTAISE